MHVHNKTGSDWFGRDCDAWHIQTLGITKGYNRSTRAASGFFRITCQIEIK